MALRQLKEGNETGTAHTYGMDFALGHGWSTGFTLQNGETEAGSGTVKCNRVISRWCAWRDSNPRPMASEATTLSG